ncbi:MAG: glycosyltransferase [Ruminococcaceae bacterium]|nr:glycosyltransferase [Oscillospiraceae bacterium]
MRILILSCNTGGGHNSAGMAIKKYFSDKNIPCEMADALAFLSEKASILVSHGHVFVYQKLPRLFGAGYKYEESHPPKFIYKSCAMGADALYHTICEQGYDTVICVHAFAAMMITEIKKRYNPDIKTYFVATDYTCSPGVGDLDVDYFFTPHSFLSDEFMSKGVAREKIVASGIPVREEFILPVNREEARKILHLPEDSRILLFCCGSMGAGPMLKITKAIQEQLTDDMYLVVVCGTNRQLYRKITRCTAESGNIRVVGFTHQVRQYMAAADLLLTKPGGLSTTEAFYQRLPVIAMDAVPGCETRNLEFLTKNELAETASNINGIVSLVIKRLPDSEFHDKISQNIESLFTGNPTKTLCDYVINKNKL